MKVGLTMSSSKNLPTNLSSKRIVVRGSGHLTSKRSHTCDKKTRVSAKRQAQNKEEKK
jgi:hypothetical protein